ncbi:MAG TPA: hypothetical protein VD905_00995, partial [Flavobacteriales bacterium]|nr:hypothetical protein [Flavobacteriales bacterium]
ATTRNFTLNTGINTVNGASVGFASFIYGTNGKALYLKNNGMLPAGNYTYCVKIIPLGVVEDGDVYCEDFEASTDDFLSLVTPYDKEEIETKLPLLTWTHSEPFNTLAKNEYFKLIVTEIKKDQNAEQAVYANPVVFSKNFVATHSVPYPQDAKELEEGKSYAWQVQKIANNIIVNKTDVWEFKLAKKETTEPLKYALLKKTQDGGFFNCINDALYFRFDEEYVSGDLHYEILNNKNESIKPRIKRDDQSKDELILNSGVNRFELSLTDYKLKEGYYTLVVLNAKKEKFYLRFYVAK